MTYRISLVHVQSLKCISFCLHICQYNLFFIVDKMCYILRNSKNADGRIQADRKEDGTQTDTILDSCW